MSPQSQAVLDAARAMPAELERVQMAEELLESTPAEFEAVLDNELLAELEARRAEYQRDPSVANPRNEVIDEE